jgi:hypothetical protein
VRADVEAAGYVQRIDLAPPGEFTVGVELAAAEAAGKEPPA